MAVLIFVWSVFVFLKIFTDFWTALFLGILTGQREVKTFFLNMFERFSTEQMQTNARKIKNNAKQCKKNANECKKLMKNTKK